MAVTPKTLCYMQASWHYTTWYYIFIELELWAIKIYIAGIGIYELFAHVILTLIR